MNPDPLCVVLAAIFTAGCMVIHGCRHHPDDVTLILLVATVGIVNIAGAAMLARTGPVMEPAFAAELVGYRPRHE